MHGLVWRVAAVLVAGTILTVGNGMTAGAQANRTAVESPVQAAKPKRPPVLAYYYIWFDAGAWARTKKDYPALGRYSSSDPRVMRQHVRWAKAAGIDGFIVSWRHTRSLDPRLEQLVKVAAEEKFKLVLIYQGLDFERQPRTVDAIRSDLTWFADRYGDNPVFHVFAKPTVIISGTENYQRTELDRMIEPVRSRLDVLGSEKSVQGYDRISDVVRGNAYYWSSLDPQRFRNHEAKLAAMALAAHRDGGLWIAPAAPGFDSRLLGKPSVVERRAGATLRSEMTAAFSSGPDAVGIISWNEFSENTHIEPSVTYGSESLDTVSKMLGGKPTAPHERIAVPTTDRVLNDAASKPGKRLSWSGLRSAVAFAALLALISTLLVRSHRQRRRGKPIGERETAAT